MTALVGLIVGAVVFSWLQNRAGTDVASATDHASSVQSVERALWLNVEVTVNHWLTGQPVLMHAAVLYYRLYYLPLVAVLLWLVFRRPEVFLTVRRTLVVMASLALLVFYLWPLSPPRFSLTGIVDVVAEHDIFSGGTSRDLTNGQNHFSAMPSLHVGWSALCAWAVWVAVRRQHPRLATLIWLFPTLMVVVVIGTGNHYVLDVAGSVLSLMISVALANLWGLLLRARRGRSDPMTPPVRRTRRRRCRGLPCRAHGRRHH